MYKAAVMGDKDSISGFSSIGLHAIETNKDNAHIHLRQLVNQSYAVIFITESLAAMIPHVIESYRQEIIPSIILIPGLTGNTGQGMEKISESVKKAVGADIFK